MWKTTQGSPRGLPFQNIYPLAVHMSYIPWICKTFHQSSQVTIIVVETLHRTSSSIGTSGWNTEGALCSMVRMAPDAGQCGRFRRLKCLWNDKRPEPFLDFSWHRFFFFPLKITKEKHCVFKSPWTPFNSPSQAVSRGLFQGRRVFLERI